jgi:hypothetical protein
MAFSFFDKNFDTILLNDVIGILYPVLNDIDKNILFKYLKKVVCCIALVYNFERDIENYKHQLFQNSYQDLKWLCTLLLEYTENSSNLKSFNDLYTKKLTNDDINKSFPKYEFSNVQFGRCIRNKEINKAIEINFNEEFIRDNANLLISSIIDSSHKLYVNWIDIIPLSYINDENLTELQLYKNTELLFKNKRLQEINFMNDIEYNIKNWQIFHSLTINEIYNVIRNFLYEEIKSIKLLIYDMKIFGDEYTIPCVAFLKKYFGEIIDLALNNVSWDIIDDSLKDNFSINKNALIEAIKTRNNLDVYSEKITTDSIERLLKAIVISFQNKFSFKKLVKQSKFKPLNQDYDDDINIDENETYSKINIREIILSFESIDNSLFYEYLQFILQKFKYTYYSKILLNEDKTLVKEDFIDYLGLSITNKNIYNFAKSFSRYKKDDKYPSFPLNWNSLNRLEKTEILDRLNDKGIYKTDPTQWFNISRYIRYIFGDEYLVKPMNIDIYNIIRDKLLFIIFDVLRCKGLLSVFTPNKILTDQNYVKRERKLILQEQIKSNPSIFTRRNKFSEKCYSYLTELPYAYSGNIFSNDTITVDTFLKLKNPVGNLTGWYTMYALDWVSQIAFCHKFINQRVSFVTGGTGIGKSTQVPKLYMYYLKALNYKTAGKVVCTQPRKTPTVQNAVRVSNELGFPIHIGKKYKNIIKETNEPKYYYIQMQHKEERYVNTVNHVSLKFITDGSLLEEIKNLHPLFKQINFDFKIMNDNLYDIIIIDEAHEHNKNMDMILTLMRDYCYFNPEIRLVILSATMDDDEPTYRRYYRDINDNLKYPINTNLKEYKLDRVNIDRRLHISPPGFGTLFEIKEFYSNDNKVDTKTFALNKVKEIIRKGLGKNKDILIFMPGKNEINELVDELNDSSNTPPNILALPFYSELPTDKKEFIENIDDMATLIKFDKFEEFRDAEVTVGNNTYTNFIICATNMAEASITIDRLYYVIETGTRKTNKYNYSARTNKLETLNISESSRKQRKGRVGRTGPGEVHYSYVEGAMKDNKILYDFSISNLSTDIFNILIPVEPTENNLIYLNLLKNEKIREQFGYLFISNPEVYKGNSNHYDYDFTGLYYPKKYMSDNYEYGYDSKTLYDAEANFYIIHPEELDIERNILGNIVNTKETRKDILLYEKNNNSKYAFQKIIRSSIQSYKVDSFYEDLEFKKYIENKNNNYITTKYGKIIRKLIATFNDYFNTEDENLPTILIQSIFLNIEKNMSKILALLSYFTNREESTSNFIASEFLIPEYDEDGDVKKDYDPRFVNLFKNKQGGSFDSEAEALIQFADILIKHVIQKNNINYNDIDREIAKDKNISVDRIRAIVDEFKEEENTIYDRKNILIDRIKYLERNLESSKTITQLSQIFKIKPKVIISFIKSYAKINDFLIKINNPDKYNINLKEDINKIKENYDNLNYNNYNKITLAFLLAQPFNIVKKIPYKNRYLSVYNPIAANMFSLPVVKIKNVYRSKRKIIKKPKKYDTYLLIDDYITSNYIYYYSIDVNKDTLHLIIKLDKSYFKLFPEIYNYNRINNITSKNIMNIDKYIEKINTYKDLDEKAKYPTMLSLQDDIKSLSLIRQTYNDILRDMS